jgi:hypothetical protein
LSEHKFTRDSFTQNLARGQLIVPYLERFNDYDEEWTFTYVPKVPDDGWHPSGDCVPSVVDLWKKALGHAERAPHKPSTNRNFQVGHFWHALLQRIICEKLKFCTPEAIETQGTKVWGWADDTTPKAWNWATGSGDICPLNLPSGWTGVFDIKTMGSAMWNKSFKTGLLPSGFDKKYECQVNVYMDFFDQEKALILGVNKDNPHGFVEFEFERNQALIDTIYAKWEYVGVCLDVGVEPEPEAEEAFVLPLTGPIG